MEERLYDVEMLYIQQRSDQSCVLEVAGRHHQNAKLTYPTVDGIEISALATLELKHAFLQWPDRPPRVLNLKFAYPVNLRLRMTGQLVIECV